MKRYQITQWCHHFLREHIRPGDLCVDATMGNGHDTLLLSRLSGPTGRVLAFDIQPEALENTKRRLSEAGAPKNYHLILDSHEHMSSYCAPGTVHCIVFNFGYLPGGDHKVSTQADSSLAAVRCGLSLLQKGGLMSLCIYSGGDSGFEERDALLAFLAGLDSRQYLVIRSDYLNRPNHPPIPVLVVRL